MLKLHHAPNSRAGRILWLLEELKLPYELNRMEFHPKALKSDEHRARHPLGRVPVLEIAVPDVLALSAHLQRGDPPVHLSERHAARGVLTLDPQVLLPEHDAPLTAVLRMALS